MSSNLKIRTISGVIFGLVMIVGLLAHPASYFAIMTAVMVVGMYELFSIATRKGELVFQKCLAVAASVLMLAIAYLFVDGELKTIYILTLVLAAMLLALPVSTVFKKPETEIAGYGIVTTSIFYIGLPIALSPVLAYSGDEFSGKLTLSFFILIWAADVGAYFLGSRFGQRPGAKKLAPSVSPLKSWWGFWGGVVLCIIAAVVLYFCKMLDFSLIHCIILGITVSTTSVCGDLFESMWKRRFGVKDSGNAIPGHGGILDRFDSSLIAIPAGTLYLSIFNLI